VHEAKYVWNLETLDARHFVDGRLIIADVFTPEFRELQAALFTALGMTPAPRDSDRQAEAESATDSDTRLRDALARCGEDTELVTLFRRAVDAHLRVLAQHKAGMESYLHLCLLANEMNTVKVRTQSLDHRTPMFLSVRRPTIAPHRNTRRTP
jgi:hypothetical protein